MESKVCYCHNFTTDDIIQDVLAHGHSTIMEKIITESKAGNCNCKENNPKKR